MAGVVFEDPKKRQLRVADELSKSFSVAIHRRAEQGAELTALGSADEVAAFLIGKLPLAKTSWSEVVGPCYASGSLQRELNVTRAALSKATRELRVLRLLTADGVTVYPAFQVREGALVQGLREVLTELRTGIDDQWTWAQWLNTPVGGSDTEAPKRRPIEQLADGEIELVVEAARHTAAAWAA